MKPRNSHIAHQFLRVIPSVTRTLQFSTNTVSYGYDNGMGVGCGMWVQQSYTFRHLVGLIFMVLEEKVRIN